MSSNYTNIENVQRLIDEAQNINWNGLVEEPTFMDIAGYPHYENVCSNILAFFFQTDAEHGMKDLVLKSLLHTINISDQHEYMTNDVSREVMSDSGNRIDLVISTDDFVVAIENKIYADLYNDLNDYSTYVDNHYPGLKKFKVVLSLTPADPQKLTNGFVNVVYTVFLNEIDNLIGQYWKDANPKYLMILNDFMKNLRKRNGGNQVNQEVIDYFSNNKTDIESFILDIKDYKVYLRSTMKMLAQKLNMSNQKNCTQWYHRESNSLFDILVHDISIDDAVIAIDTVFCSEKYDIRIWLRKPGKSNLKNKTDLFEFLIKKGLDQSDLRNTQDRHVYDKDFLDQMDVVNKLNEIVNKLCQ